MSTSTLLDSGTTGMFINCTFVQKHRLETNPLPNLVPVHNVDVTLNENGSITEEVKAILQYGQHMEKAYLVVANHHHWALMAYPSQPRSQLDLPECQYVSMPPY